MMMTLGSCFAEGGTIEFCAMDKKRAKNFFLKKFEPCNVWLKTFKILDLLLILHFLYNCENTLL